MTPVYFVWLTPELFNFTLVLARVLPLELQTDRAAAGLPRHARLERFLRSPRSDYAAPSLLGIATFSKPTHILLMLPIGGDWRSSAREVAAARADGVCFSVVVVGLFGAERGDRPASSAIRAATQDLLLATTGFPFANTWETFDNRGVSVATDAVPFDILLHRDTAPVLALEPAATSRWAATAAFCRTSSRGLSPWPCSSCAGRSAGPGSGWLPRGLVFGAVALMCYMPYTYSGGGGPVGNRYFLSFYPLFLFLMPRDSQRLADRDRPRRRRALHRQDPAEPVLLVVQSGEHAKAGPLRLLPIERTLLNDLPVSADADARGVRSAAVRRPGVFHGRRRVSAGGGWLLGARRVPRRHPPACARDVEAPTSATCRCASARSASRSPTAGAEPRGLSAGGIGSGWIWRRVKCASFRYRPGAGVPYKPSRFPTNFVYGLSVSSSAGFVPFLHDSSNPTAAIWARCVQA